MPFGQLFRGTFGARFRALLIRLCGPITAAGWGIQKGHNGRPKESGVAKLGTHDEKLVLQHLLFHEGVVKRRVDGTVPLPREPSLQCWAKTLAQRR
jgi:hypothetical protein